MMVDPQSKSKESRDDFYSGIMMGPQAEELPFKTGSACHAIHATFQPNPQEDAVQTRQSRFYSTYSQLAS